MDPNAVARQLRQRQTHAEKTFWYAVRAGRFAGFKFRRQHPFGPYVLDFYCPIARLAVELDGSQHGTPEGGASDCVRTEFLTKNGIETFRLWNHQWLENREGILLDLWCVLVRRTGHAELPRLVRNHQFVPPAPGIILPAPAPPDGTGEK